VIVEKMARRFKQFMSLLDDEPASDPSVALFQQGLTVNEVVSRLAPELGGVAMVAGQQAVQEQVRKAIDRQATAIYEQAEEIAELRKYIDGLHRYIAQLETALAQRGRS
jgi:hypothetical protein